MLVLVWMCGNSIATLIFQSHVWLGRASFMWSPDCTVHEVVVVDVAGAMCAVALSVVDYS